jgi:hypothetical protein
MPRVSNRPMVKNSPHLGPMLGFLKYFRRKFFAKILAFFVPTTTIFAKNDHNIGF